MSSTRGPPFTSRDRRLGPWTLQLNTILPGVRAQLQSHALVRRPSEGTGLGIFTQDGCVLPPNTKVVAYWGELTFNPPLWSNFVAELPVARLDGLSVVPYVDARLACLRGDPPPDQAALLNHCCRASDPSCRMSFFRDPASALPVMVGTTRRLLLGGTELTYDYDAGFSVGPYTLNRLDVALQMLAHPAGPHPQPCRCAGLAPCPKDRFLPP